MTRRRAQRRQNARVGLPEPGSLGHAPGVPNLRVRALLPSTVVAALASCVTVQPHQRGELAKPEMNPASDQMEETFHSHIESAREGGFGGHGAQGGGCGCG